MNKINSTSKSNKSRESHKFNQPTQIKQTTNQATNHQHPRSQTQHRICRCVSLRLQVVSVSPQRIFMRKLISKLELSDPEAMNSSARTTWHNGTTRAAGLELPWHGSRMDHARVCFTAVHSVYSANLQCGNFWIWQ